MRCRFLACERHNLHNDLCLINPPVISFDGESINNLYKINKEILLRIIPNRADVTGLAKGKGGGGALHPLFCGAKIKKENEGRIEKVSKQRLLKGCHQGENVTILVIFTILF